MSATSSVARNFPSSAEDHDAPGGRPGSWTRRYFAPSYWKLAGAEYTAARTGREVEYVVAAAARAAGLGGGRLLDLACGQGRHSIELARLGWEVTGVDQSARALGVAEAMARAVGVTVDWVTLDLLEASWPFRDYDVVICVQATGWGGDADQVRFLRQARNALRREGVMVLDFSSADWIVANFQGEAEAFIGDRTFAFSRQFDLLTRRSTGTLTVLHGDATEAVLAHDVRLYSPPELSGLAREAGFDVVAVDGDFVVGAPVTLQTRYVQIVARPAAIPPGALSVATYDPGCKGEADVQVKLDLRQAVDEAQWLAPDAAARMQAVMTDASAVESARAYGLDEPYASSGLVACLERHFGCELPPGGVVLTAGATSGLHMLAALTRHGAVVCSPSCYPDLAAWARLQGCRVEFVDDVGSAAALSLAAGGVILVDRPSLLASVAEVQQVARLARAASSAGALLVVDESSANYLEPRRSVVRLLASEPSLLVVRSFSKGYLAGGLRIGFVAGTPPGGLRAIVPPLQVSALSVQMVQALLGDGEDALAPLRQRIREVKPKLLEALDRAGLRPLAGDPAVPWVIVEGGDETLQALAGRGVLGKRTITATGAELVRLVVPLSAARVRAMTELLG